MEKEIDWFTRIIAILGLIISIVATVLPYYKDISDEKELLAIDVKSEKGNSIIKISNDINKSKAIQIPYIITLTNVGKVKLSITSYNIEQIVNKNTISYFNGLDGGLFDLNNNKIVFPKIIDSGESIMLRAYVGFIASKEISEFLYKEYEKKSPIILDDIMISLAKLGKTLYGSNATYEEFSENNYIISVDNTFINSPKYNIRFKTGKLNEFVDIFSDS